MIEFETTVVNWISTGFPFYQFRKTYVESKLFFIRPITFQYYCSLPKKVGCSPLKLHNEIQTKLNKILLQIIKQKYGK